LGDEPIKPVGPRNPIRISYVSVPRQRIVLFEIPEGSLSQEETVVLSLNQAATPSRPEASTEALFGFGIP